MVLVTAATVLACFARSETVSIPDLVAQLKSESHSQRFRAIKALTDLGPAAKDAVPTLVERLEGKEEDSFLRKDIAATLGAIGPVAASVTVPALVGTFDEEDWQVKDAAVRAAARLGDAAIPHLLRATEQAYRTWVDRKTSELGHPPDSESAWDIQLDLRAFTCGVVKAIEPPPVSTLLEQLAGDWRIGVEAAAALGCLGPAARAAIPDLERVVKTGQGDLRDEAAKALKAISALP